MVVREIVTPNGVPAEKMVFLAVLLVKTARELHAGMPKLMIFWLKMMNPFVSHCFTNVPL